MKILDRFRKVISGMAIFAMTAPMLFIGATPAYAISPVVQPFFKSSPQYVRQNNAGDLAAYAMIPIGATSVNFYANGGIALAGTRNNGVVSAGLVEYRLYTSLPAGQYSITGEYFDGSWVSVPGNAITYSLDKPWFNYISPDSSNFTFRPSDNPARVAIDDEFNQFTKITFQLYNYNIGTMTRGTNVGGFDVLRENCDTREAGYRVLCDINKSSSWSNLSSGYYTTDLTSSDPAGGGIRVADPGTDSHYFYIDTTPPTLTDFTVDNYSSVMSSTAMLSANAVDFSGIDNVEFYLTEPRVSDGQCDGNGKKLISQKSTAQDIDSKYRVTLDTSAYNGNYCVNAISEDNAASHSTISKSSILLDNTAPAGGKLTMITSDHPSGLTATPVSGVYTLTMPLSFDGVDKLQSLSLLVTDDNLNQDNVPVFINGDENGYMQYNSGVWNYAGQTSQPVFIEGSQVITATFSDNAGNTTPLTLNFTTDITAPASTATAGSYVYGSWTNNNVTITFGCTDTGGSGCETTPDPFNNQYPYHCIDSTNSCTPDTPTHDVLVSGEGIWYIRYFSRDNAGNTESIQSVQVKIDKTPPAAPSLSTPANNSTVNGNTLTNDWEDSPESDIHHYVYESYRNETATDLRWSQVVNAPTSQKTATNVANTTFWWRVKAVDNLGNTSDWSELWKVTVDNNPPVISDHENMLVEATSPAGAEVTYVLPSATDAVDGFDVVGCLPTSGSLFPLGDTSVICTATDSAGHVATSTFDVKVVDTKAPVITVTGGDFTLEAGSAYIEQGATWFDIVDGSGAVSVISGTVNILVPGDYTITYSVTDVAGNTAIANRGVTVEDTTAPIITLTGTTGQITVGGTYTELGATALDIVDGSFEATPTGSVNTNLAGTYVITYNATDSAGNNATPVTRTVEVVAPAISGNSIQLVQTVPTPTITLAPTTEPTPPAVLGAETSAEDKEVKGNVSVDTNKEDDTQIAGSGWWNWWYLPVIILLLGAGYWFIFGAKRRKKNL